MLEIRGLDVYYGAVHALKGVSVRVEQGEVVTLIGANGAGKTSLLRAISGLVKPRAGSLKFEGRELGGMEPHDIVKLGLSHAPEGRQIFANMSVHENLELGAYLRKDSRGVHDDQERIFTLFPRLREREKQGAGTLSGGEQQMLAVSRALMLRPKLLLLDEPSFGLAPLIVRELFEIFRTINQRDGISMLLVEQNASLALKLADHAYLLETGRVVVSGTAESIRNDEAVRRSYLGY